MAATHPTMSGGLYISPYMGTRSSPEIFDYWSLYGGPRCAASGLLCACIVHIDAMIVLCCGTAGLFTRHRTVTV